MFCWLCSTVLCKCGHAIDISKINTYRTRNQNFYDTLPLKLVLKSYHLRLTLVWLSNSNFLNLKFSCQSSEYSLWLSWNKFVSPFLFSKLCGHWKAGHSGLKSVRYWKISIITNVCKQDKDLFIKIRTRAVAKLLLLFLFKFLWISL